MNKNLQGSGIVVLANGRFPAAGHCLEILENASRIICCDEAADHLLEYGRVPDVIIGDLDSVSEATKEAYQDIIMVREDQETNDLTKAVTYCIEQKYPSVTILGATGIREDHTLGNISLLMEYNNLIEARIVSDYGEFSILKSGVTVASHPGEKISFFSVDNRVRVTSEGLKYKLDHMQLHNWWRASLNEVEGESFTLHFDSDWPLILYRLLDDRSSRFSK
jgi:thiamine pyrophosphokinase